MSAEFEVYKSSEQYRWRLRTALGKIVAFGQAYETKADALAGIEVVRRAAKTATIRDTTNE